MPSRSNYLDKGALLSKEEPQPLYRYVLWRTWKEPAKICLFVMLNPSTADHEKDDPTLRKCVSFAEREGCGEVRVVNLFALRSPHPKALGPDWTRSIGNPDNDSYLQLEAIGCDLLIAAWGSNETMGRAGSVLKVLRQFKDVYCLGTSKEGHPNHPLYLPLDTPLKLYYRRTQ